MRALIKAEKKRYVVSVQIADILNESDARQLAETVRDLLNDLPGDICVDMSEYERVPGTDAWDLPMMRMKRCLLSWLKGHPIVGRGK